MDSMINYDFDTVSKILLQTDIWYPFYYTLNIDYTHGLIESYDGKINLDSLIRVLWAALHNGRNISRDLGLKVGFGVLISDNLSKQIVEQHKNNLADLHKRSVNLFGVCSCRVTCPMLFGAFTCQANVQRSMLLSELIIPDVASIIREYLLS